MGMGWCTKISKRTGKELDFWKRLSCDWSDEEDLKSLLIKSINSDEFISPWFCLSMEDNINNHYLRAKKFSSKFILKNQNNNSYLNKKIRIGYYAADFHQHAGMINMEGIFKNHNKDEYSIFVTCLKKNSKK